MRWISKSEFKTMPWKNGLGITSEIEVFPKSANFSRSLSKKRQFFHRPIPLASQLSPCHSGQPVFPVSGLRSAFDSDRRRRPSSEWQTFAARTSPFFLRGEHIHCELLGQAVEDLGLIYRRGQAQAEMEIFNLTKPLDLRMISDVAFLKVLRGELQFQNQILNSSDILRLEKNESIQLKPQDSGVKIVVIKIN